MEPKQYAIKITKRSLKKSEKKSKTSKKQMIIKTQ